MSAESDGLNLFELPVVEPYSQESIDFWQSYAEASKHRRDNVIQKAGEISLDSFRVRAMAAAELPLVPREFEEELEG